MAKATATTAVAAFLTASIAAEKQPAASENYVELPGTVSSNVDTAATTVDTVTIPSDIESVSASDTDDLVTFIASPCQLDTVDIPSETEMPPEKCRQMLESDMKQAFARCIGEIIVKRAKDLCEGCLIDHPSHMQQLYVCLTPFDEKVALSFAEIIKNIAGVELFMEWLEVFRLCDHCFRYYESERNESENKSNTL